MIKCRNKMKGEVQKAEGHVMANVLAHISSIIIPALIFYIVSYGLVNRSNVYEDFIRGAADGFKTVIQIMPTLIGLMMAVGILRASGFLDFLGQAAGRLTEGVGLSADLVPLIFIKLFSSSAATGLVLDIFKTYGTDSRMGLITSIMMSCTDNTVKLRRNEEYLQSRIQSLSLFFARVTSRTSALAHSVGDHRDQRGVSRVREQ